MAERVWQGGTSTAGTLAANYVGGSAPTTNDVIVLDERAVRPFSTDLNFGSTVLLGLVKTPGYRFGIGGAGVSLQAKFTATGAYVRLDSREGDDYLSIDASSFRLVESGRGNVYLTGNGAAGTGVLNPVVQSGRLVVQAGAIIGAGNQLGGHVSMDAHASSTPTTWTMDGGFLDTLRSIPTLDLQNAEAILREAAACSTATLVRFGAVLRHLGGGTLAALTVRAGGTFSRVGATRDATVTASTFYQGAKIELKPATAVTNINGSGGTGASTIVGQLSQDGLETV